MHQMLGFFETHFGFYCFPSSNLMGTMERITANISFGFKDTENKKHNFQVHASVPKNFTGHLFLTKVKLAKHLCKRPPFLSRLQIMLSLLWS